MSENPIDLATFSELKEATGDDFVAELVLTFLDEATEMLADLRNAVENSDAEAYRRAAHSMKSNASTFGAGELAELARRIELGPCPDVGDLKDADALEAEFQQSAEALRSLIDG